MVVSVWHYRHQEAGTAIINTNSVQTVNGSKFSQHFMRPCYDSYCFANIPATIEFLFSGKQQKMLPMDVFGNLPTQYDSVIFFFVDAFGWIFFERYAEKYPFLKAVLADGVVSKMTSQFPSTTAAHVTCIHTGLNVGQSGVYEWNYYEPLVDAMISPLLFSYAGDKIMRGTIKSSGIAADRFFPQQTFYRKLRDLGIASHVFQSKAYTPSSYSDIVFRGADVHPYTHLTEAFSLLVDLIQKPDTKPSYYFLYFDRIDTVCHNHGPYSWRADEAIDSFLTMLDQHFYRNLRGKAGNTLFIMTADHGQVEVSPSNTYYINRRLPEILPYLKTNRKGMPLAPAGSARDMFLHVEEKHIDTVIRLLRERLAGVAEIYRTQDLLEQQFFGLEEPSPTLLARVGNVVILPYIHETVWWYEEGHFAMHFRGHHGGLTPDEMTIPLFVLPL